jgi:hypothetical protein
VRPAGLREKGEKHQSRAKSAYWLHCQSKLGALRA